MASEWQCLVCGYVEEGDSPPTECPVCGSPFTAFQRSGESLQSRLAGVRIVNRPAPGHRYVIIGNSAAGRSAAQAARALDPAGEITVISEEHVPIYARPMLPDLISGMSPGQLLASGSVFSDDGVQVMLRTRVEAVETAMKVVTLDDGSEIPYDSLLLATGSQPVQVPWPGSDAEGIAYFRSYGDAERLASMATQSRRAVVVGGGLLGLEFVRAFHRAGLTVTQLIRETQVGSPALDMHAGAVMRGALEDLGVVVICEDEAESFSAVDGKVRAVVTKKGRTLECDVVGIAIGARPRTELAASAGAQVSRGIMVDRAFRTSADSIYAAGDAVEAYDRLWQAPRVNTSWRNSLEQGELAGISMAGGEVDYAGAVAVNYQITAGLPFCSLGISNPPESDDFTVERSTGPAGRSYVKIVKRGGHVVGAVMIGDLTQAPELEARIRNWSNQPS